MVVLPFPSIARMVGFRVAGSYNYFQWMEMLKEQPFPKDLLQLDKPFGHLFHIDF